MKSRRHVAESASQGLFTTAGAMIALVAVAAVMTSSVVAAPVGSRCDVRQTMTEAAKVRAAVAAVAAAARTLVDGERLVHALPVEWNGQLSGVAESAALRCQGDDRTPIVATLQECLLDLPPPVR